MKRNERKERRIKIVKGWYKLNFNDRLVKDKVEKGEGWEKNEGGGEGRVGEGVDTRAVKDRFEGSTGGSKDISLHINPITVTHKLSLNIYTIQP